MDPAVEPFTAYVGLDVVRCVMALLGVVLVGLVVKIAYKRGTEAAQEGYPPPYMIVTPLLSFALFVFLAVVLELRSLGHVADWPLPVRVVAITLGTYSALIYCEVPGFRAKNDDGRRARPTWTYR
jgi:hypothetical protein